MNALLLPPPSATTTTTTHFLRHRNISNPPLSTASYKHSPFRSSITSLSLSEDDVITQHDDDVISPYVNRRYDFSPLLHFLSTSGDSTESQITESQLAGSYRSVPASLWHYLLKTLATSSSSPDSVSTVYALVDWLHRHKLCFSYEFLYSILIHALGRSEMLYEAFLLSQNHALTPLTYNVLIGACARNDDLEKAVILMNRMRAEGVIQGNGLTPKVSTVVSIVSLLGSLGRVEEAEAVFEEISDGGLKPRTRAYNAVLKAYVNNGSLKDAEWVVDEMERNGVSRMSIRIVF
ncbi:putative tetratricopeptide-like helical domain superfamily, pentacotripeptide-repeat region of PRORP [Helianthus annuus]|nr:putative tetratricopeptide-like helical domain superfamily, pentacotripeptide-repeat region of PRORP [Helianthus annuus]